MDAAPRPAARAARPPPPVLNPASARPPPSPSPHRYRPKAAKKTYANQLPTHIKGQASQLVTQARRHQRRNTPPDAGSYFRRRRRRVFDWIHNVAKWTSDGPEEREDGSQRVLRHYRRNHLSLETLSAPLPLGETSKQLQQALSEATYAPYQTRVDAFQKAMDATRVSWEVGRVELLLIVKLQNLFFALVWATRARLRSAVTLPYLSYAADDAPSTRPSKAAPREKIIG